MATNIDKFLEPSEVGAATAVPIGGIIAWMAPTVGAPEPTPPTGYEYCDGTAISTVGSTMLGFSKPTLMRTVAAPAAAQQFVRGADTTTAYGGATAFIAAGADTHTHTGTTDSTGSHAHNMNSHTHSTAHNHTISTDGGHVHDEGTLGGTISGAGSVFTTNDGSHNHSGVTGSASPATSGTPSVANTSNAGTHSHSLNVNAGSTLPAYVEIAWIIRVL